MCSKLRRQWCEGITLTTISAPSSASLKSPVALTDAGRVHPGRNISLTLDFAIDLTTSFSSAHSRTSWLPRRPATMARAVPHAPPPMTAIRLMVVLRQREAYGCQSGFHCQPAGDGYFHD